MVPKLDRAVEGARENIVLSGMQEPSCGGTLCGSYDLKRLEVKMVLYCRRPADVTADYIISHPTR